MPEEIRRDNLDIDGGLRVATAEEEQMDVESVLAGMANGSITTSIGMEMPELLDKFPRFGDVSLRDITKMVDGNIDFIWEWTDRADPGGRFFTWKEMYVKEKPVETPPVRTVVKRRDKRRVKI
jgi:hypothetical protein